MEEKKENNLGFIFGIISIFAWIIPLFGYPITILGIIYSSKERKNNNKKAKISLILSIIFLIITIANSILGAIIAYNDTKLDWDETTENSNEDIGNFIVNSYLSTSQTVGSHDPEVYYFNTDGTFAYYRGDYCVKTSDESISYYGTYEVEDKKLILNILKKTVAVNGTYEEDEINGKCLINYDEQIIETNENIEYVFNEINSNLISFDNITLYKIGGDTSNVKKILKEYITNSKNSPELENSACNFSYIIGNKTGKNVDELTSGILGKIKSVNCETSTMIVDNKLKLIFERKEYNSNYSKERVAPTSYYYNLAININENDVDTNYLNYTESKNENDLIFDTDSVYVYKKNKLYFIQILGADYYGNDWDRGYRTILINSSGKVLKTFNSYIDFFSKNNFQTSESKKSENGFHIYYVNDEEIEEKSTCNYSITFIEEKALAYFQKNNGNIENNGKNYNISTELYDNSLYLVKISFVNDKNVTIEESYIINCITLKGNILDDNKEIDFSKD